MKISKIFRRAGAAVLSTVVLTSTAFAAGTNAGVEAGFFELHTDLTTVLDGAGGFVILIASVLIGAIALAFTGRATLAIMSAAVAIFLGYGVQTLTSFAGVTADVEMIDVSMLEVAPSGLDVLASVVEQPAN